MDTILTPVSARRQEALLNRLDLAPPPISDSRSRKAEELAHELRQPLGVIESLAYFLEITAEDDQVRGHLQRIQAMVLQANRILERSCGTVAEAV
jgi:signal transduction histidine kinase